METGKTRCGRTNILNRLSAAKLFLPHAGARLIGSVLIFAAIFLLTSPTVRIYLLFFDGLWLWGLFRYGGRKNARLFQRGMLISIGCNGAFFLVKLLSGRPLRAPEREEWSLLLLAGAEMAVGLVLCRRKDGRSDIPLPLYGERKYDLERIRNYITEFEILGVNAGWGKGKSFLMEYLKADGDIQKQFEVIQINLLSCDLDAVELILVEELEKVFQKNRVYSENSHYLKSLLGSNAWTGMLWEQVGGNTAGLTASFDGFRQELKQLPKRVLVIFEDIDRIFDKDTIQKVFAIGEYLSGKELHIIFQYDAQALARAGFDRDYLEKYIPYTVNLTDIPYDRLVEYLWDELKMDRTPLDRKKVCAMGHRRLGQFELKQLLGVETDVSVRLGGQVSARKVRIFLSELKELMLTSKEFSKPENVETVCAAVFIKHFFDELYGQLRIGESPLESLSLTIDGGAYPLPRFLARLREKASAEEEGTSGMAGHFQKAMEEEGNREVLGTLLLLGYTLELEQRGPGLEGIVSESEKSLRQREKNEKIDRIVWNVLANGTSELTDVENAIAKLDEEVLMEGSVQAQEQAWRKYADDMFYERLWKDNGTIFRIGLGAFLPLFQAMAIVHADEEWWTRFLTFYFSQYQQDTISRGLVDALKYCNVRSKKVFLQVIRFFNQLKVAGNLNQDRSYQLFLEKYMGDATSLSCSKRMESWMFRCSDTIEERSEYKETMLEEYRKELETARGQCEEQGFGYVAEELSDIIAFIDKNLELIRCEGRLPERGPSVQVTDIQSRWVHQEEVDRLKKLGEGAPERFAAELEKSFREGRIYYREWEDICKNHRAETKTFPEAEDD